MPLFIQSNLVWLVGGLITVLGLFVYGLGDLLRLSFSRAWAISSVAFSESIRRRVLWITPLAILGVIVVSQLAQPNDEQDAIRQTVKFCLFASGMLVTLLGMILACTNLPKEIENRVIFTIVTKPTTRLEIVIGKIIGFGKVSLAVLAIMGAFSFVYLHVRAWQLKGQVVARLNSGAADPLSRATDEYYASAGLLTARSLELPQSLNILATDPKADDTTRTFYGNGDGDMLVPFDTNVDELTAPGDSSPMARGLIVRLNLAFESTPFGADAPAASPLPVGVAAPTSSPVGTLSHANVSISLLDSNLITMVSASLINGGLPLRLDDSTGQTAAICLIPPENAALMLRSTKFYVDVAGTSPGVKYTVNVKRTSDPHATPLTIGVLGPTIETSRLIPPAVDPAAGDGSFALPKFRARLGMRNLEQLRGGPADTTPVAIYRFTDAHRYTGGKIGFEMRCGLETNYAGEGDDATHTEISLINRTTGQRSPVVTIYPESNRTSFFDFPAEYAGDGNFDLEIRNLSEGHYVGLGDTSLSMVSSSSGFDLNFAKSLLIIWMLSLLVVIISIFCSTFLSWPIAIVLTLLLLLGHWGVIQLGDTLAPGIGNQVVTDFFGNSTTNSQAKVVSNSVEALAKILNSLGSVLPDIEQFSAIEQIEKGLTIPTSQLLAALKTLVTFGVPTVVLSYVLLRNKEVAP